MGRPFLEDPQCKGAFQIVWLTYATTPSLTFHSEGVTPLTVSDTCESGTNVRMRRKIGILLPAAPQRIEREEPEGENESAVNKMKQLSNV
ncbi:hypothetical protein PKNOH_S130210900 [Plasmodium knowlesi]|uniref:Uncharacterized protein n=1 Tax=Plasmodium knowlesi TaxID=5850 RepID=A0A1Y3DJX9_PLAKN|nr:hypothetical protein PKNOH_S130210900 [Plasmodium knowlesi]